MNGYPTSGVDDNKMNNNFISILKGNRKSSQENGEDVKDNPHTAPAGGKGNNDLFKSDTMNGWTEVLESMRILMEEIQEITSDPLNTTISEEETDNSDLLDQLNQIFTPILVMQGFEGDMSDQIKEAFSEASVLLEKNIIKFDEQARMAQLIAVCSLLIAKKKNSPKYQMYEKAATIRNQMKLEIQKDEYNEAKVLAQQYLVKIATTNNSSVARDAANDLLPETQH